MKHLLFFNIYKNVKTKFNKKMFFTNNYLESPLLKHITNFHSRYIIFFYMDRKYLISESEEKAEQTKHKNK